MHHHFTCVKRWASFPKKGARRATRSDLKTLYALEELLPGDDV